MYPYQKAFALMQEIKHRGVFQDGQSYLDKFRHLVTQIGNSLGFARLLRSASISYCSSNIEFLPELEEEKGFKEMAELADLTEITKESAGQLDEIYQTWKNAFSERQDYLRLLTKSFDGKLNAETHSHLKYFYQIIPTLMINYVESMLIAKEKLKK